MTVGRPWAKLGPCLQESLTGRSDFHTMKRVKLASGLAGGVREGFPEELQQQGRCSRKREQRSGSCNSRAQKRQPVSVSSWESPTTGSAVCPRRKRGITGVYVGMLMILQQPQYLRPQFPHVYSEDVFCPPALTTQHTYLHEDGALTGCLILVSLVHRLFLNLLPVSFQFPVSSFGLQGGKKETSEFPSLPAHFS